MNAELAANGVVISRTFLGAADLARLRGIADRGYAGVGAGRGEASTIENVKSWGGLGMPVLPQVCEPEPELSEALGAIEATVTALLGEQGRIVSAISLFRRHLTSSSQIPWHIDADGAGTVGYDPCFNIWLPFMTVGRTLPSLEFVVGSHRRMREVAFLAADNAGRSDEWIAEAFPHTPLYTPLLEPGDAVIFDHYTLHRTQPLPTHGERISGEFRFTLQYWRTDAR